MVKGPGQRQEEVSGHTLRVPTIEESMRIKAWLVVTRNYSRDHIDVAALADHIGIERAGQVLARMDEYYDEINRRPETVASQVARQLADPRPVAPLPEQDVVDNSHLAGRWRDWDNVRATLADVAEAMVAARTEERP